MTDHEAISDSLRRSVSELWRVVNDVTTQAVDLTLLGLAHYAKAKIPDIQHLVLDEQDENDYMTASGFKVAGSTTVVPLWDYDEDLQEEIDGFARDIERFQLEAFEGRGWTDRRTMRHEMVTGDLDVDQVIATLGPKYAGLIDPPPDLSDRQAVLAWLDIEEQQP